MKKQILSILPLIVVGCLAGCSKNQDYDIYKDLENFTLENKEDYASIGAGSLSEESSAAKKQASLFKVKERDEFGTAYYGSSYNDYGSEYASSLESNNEFYLIGQLKNEDIKKLSFRNKNNSLNVCIQSFCDVGNFIGFSPKIPDAILNANSSRSKNATSTGPEQPIGHALEIGYHCLFEDCILSKQTGKIYKISEEISSSCYPISYKVLDDGSLFLLSSAVYHIFENEDGLNFKKIGSTDGCAASDKFGNILTKRGIFTPSDLKFHKTASYFEDATINYDPLLEIFWAKNNGDFYIFNENSEWIGNNK